MTCEPYWGLFWATGMPEVWLMGRSGPRAGPEGNGPWEAADMPADVKSPTSAGEMTVPQGPA